jgi:uncharacterized glyoxalase superfamily protein PhnB
MATRKASGVSKTSKAKAAKRRAPAAKSAAKVTARTKASRSSTAAKAATKTTAKAAAKASAKRHKDRAKPETLRLRSITPSLTVGDLARSITFYTEALGFLVEQRWTDAEGVLRGVMLKAGTCEIGLAQDDWAKGKDRKKGEGFRVWCETTQDIDALAERIKASGCALTEEPSDQSWGGRSLSLDDPDGFHLTIHRDQ